MARDLPGSVVNSMRVLGLIVAIGAALMLLLEGEKLLLRRLGVSVS